MNFFNLEPFTVLFAARHETNRRLVQRGLYQGWTNFPKIFEPLRTSRCQVGHKKQGQYLEDPEILRATVQKIVTQSTLEPGICAPLACITYHRFFPELDVLILQYFSWYNDCTSNECQFDYQQRRQISPFRERSDRSRKPPTFLVGGYPMFFSPIVKRPERETDYSKSVYYRN